MRRIVMIVMAATILTGTSVSTASAVGSDYCKRVHHHVIYKTNPCVPLP